MICGKKHALNAHKTNFCTSFCILVIYTYRALYIFEICTIYFVLKTNIVTNSFWYSIIFMYF